MLLICLGISWLAGIILASFFYIPFILAFTCLVPLSLSLLLHRHRKILFLTALYLLVFYSGAWYCRSNLPEENPENLLFYNDRGTVEVHGIIAREPEPKTKSIQLHLDTESIRLDDEWHPVSGTALIFVPLYSAYEYGDVIRVTGKPQTPPQLEDFDYEHYLAVKGIYTTFAFPDIEVIDKGRASKPLQWIYSFRRRISDIIGKTIPEPQASFTRSVVLGMRSSLHDSVTEEFRVTGTAHLLAISGLHLSIIAGIFITIGRRIFGRKGYVYVWLALAVVWFYAVLTGLNPPVLRATIMVSAFLAAEFFGRQNSAFISIVVAAAIMTVISPSTVWDVSFQMSFAAMAGVIFIYPPVQRLIRNLIRRYIGETGVFPGLACTVTDGFSISLGAVLAVWPLVAYYFGTVSPVSPLATLFTLPFLPLVIVSGIITGLTGFVFLPLAEIIGWTNQFFSSCIVQTVRLFSVIPPIDISNLTIIFPVIYYVFLIVVVRYAGRKLQGSEPEILTEHFSSFFKREWIITCLSVAAVFTLAACGSLPDKNLHTCFLDVGQGDAILIQKGNRQVLIDGGPNAGDVMYHLGENMPFYDRTIELVVLTHSDSDHLTGLVEVVNRYRVKTVIYPNMHSDSGLYHTFMDLLDDLNIEHYPVAAGQQIQSGKEVCMDILNPSPETAYSNIDNASIVLMMKSGNFSFLFTGDIMKEVEIQLLSERLVSECTVLKLAHHGSATSTSMEFLNVVKPAIAVISAGEGNRFGHPSYKVLARLQADDTIRIYRTDMQGTIEFITDGDELRVVTEK
ncbi:MAG: DNA internalization-related competence protein ComEC/Rec2 [Dehalococcoidales bacterium]|nr:DNA internalization-related competence protein ComEC/Rec2 [Dehalococcoidales bacterium]